MNKNIDNTALSVYECGWEKSNGGRSGETVPRKYYTLHFVVSGKGEYSANGKPYKLTAGEMFLIPPDTGAHYSADCNDPWIYFWVGFNGEGAEKPLEAAGFINGRHTLKVKNPEKTERIMRSLSQYGERTLSSEYGMLGHLYLLFAELAGTVSSKKHSESYVSMAVKYIDSRFSQDIGVDAIAFHIGIERSYLYKVFKEAMGVSPQEYLISVRLLRAASLLQSSGKNLKAIASECGYPNYSNFSKMFKRKFGISPKEYSKNFESR